MKRVLLHVWAQLCWMFYWCLTLSDRNLYDENVLAYKSGSRKRLSNKRIEYIRNKPGYRNGNYVVYDVHYEGVLTEPTRNFLNRKEFMVLNFPTLTK